MKEHRITLTEEERDFILDAIGVLRDEYSTTIANGTLCLDPETETLANTIETKLEEMEGDGHATTDTSHGDGIESGAGHDTDTDTTTIPSGPR